MINNNGESNEELFFPYYINQARLLDLYAILNGGYSEYEEIQSTATQENKKAGKAKAEANGGFKIFNLGGSIEGGLEKSSSEQGASTIRRVQTTTSVLSLVTQTLRSKHYICDIESASEGSFVMIPVNLKINSIKALIKEAEELVELSEKMQALDKTSNGPKLKSDMLRQMKQLSDVAKELFGAEEIISETEKYAVIGSISDEHLYQAVRSDIVGVELNCLAQVRRVYKGGTQLMKNTVFTKIQDSDSKVTLIESLAQLTKDSNFEYEAEAIPEITGKPVYQLEIVALYQASYPHNS